MNALTTTLFAVALMMSPTVGSASPNQAYLAPTTIPSQSWECPRGSQGTNVGECDGTGQHLRDGSGSGQGAQARRSGEGLGPYDGTQSGPQDGTGPRANCDGTCPGLGEGAKLGMRDSSGPRETCDGSGPQGHQGQGHGKGQLHHR